MQVHHVDAHVPKSQATEVPKNNQKLPRLKWLRWIWIGNIYVNYYYLSGSMTPQDIKEEMQHIGGLMTEEQNLPWILFIDVKNALQLSKSGC